MTEPASFVGRQLGAYRILSPLGAGGMGEVYRAYDEKLQRAAAVKVLRSADAPDPAANARLLREARAAAALNHPNICTVYEVGEVDGTSYFVRVPGATTELLAVDRGNELFNTRAAAEAGVGPRVAGVIPELDAFALEWVDGTPGSNESLRAPGMPSRIGAVLRELHRGPRFRDDFDMFRLSERYLALVLHIFERPEESTYPQPARVTGTVSCTPPL